MGGAMGGGTGMPGGNWMSQLQGLYGQPPAGGSSTTPSAASTPQALSATGTPVQTYTWGNETSGMPQEIPGTSIIGGMTAEQMNAGLTAPVGGGSVAPPPGTPAAPAPPKASTPVPAAAAANQATANPAAPTAPPGGVAPWNPRYGAAPAVKGMNQQQLMQRYGNSFGAINKSAMPPDLLNWMRWNLGEQRFNTALQGNNIAGVSQI